MRGRERYASPSAEPGSRAAPRSGAKPSDNSDRLHHNRAWQQDKKCRVDLPAPSVDDWLARARSSSDSPGCAKTEGMDGGRYANDAASDHLALKWTRRFHSCV